MSPQDCKVTKYALCYDPNCTNRTNSVQGLYLLNDLAVFTTGAPRTPITLFIGALSPSRQNWSSLPTTFEVCGYEKIMAKNSSAYIIDYFMIMEQELIFKNITMDFNNTSPNNSCPIVSYRLQAVDNDTTYE